MTRKEKERRSKICIKCQKCCKEVAIPTTLTKDDKEGIDFYTKRGFDIYFPPDKKRIDIVITNFPCPNLTSKGCRIYKRRPKVCREYNGAEDYGDECQLPE